jgi:hypothetical protein
MKQQQQQQLLLYVKFYVLFLKISISHVLGGSIILVYHISSLIDPLLHIMQSSLIDPLLHIMQVGSSSTTNQQTI